MNLLRGTSLYPATEAKLGSLYKEFSALRNATASIEWCQKYWWDEVDGMLTLDDWMLVDAFYRSRALELPGLGEGMVPFVDMANHVSGEETKAHYEADEEGNALLLLRDGVVVENGEEVTITYGDEKGACEMIFSYGFLEEGMSSARDLFLDLVIPEDDPLKTAKQAVARSAPGVRLYESKEGKLHWHSDYIWWICVNEEDGLQIELVRTVEGDSEISARWNGQDLESGGTSSLRSLLEKNGDMWDVFHLRAVATLQDRVEQQLRTLYDTEDDIQEQSVSEDIRERPRSLAFRLRELETALLEQFYEHFESEKARLVDSNIVQTYLLRQQQASDDHPGEAQTQARSRLRMEEDEDEDEDFS